MLSAPSLSGLRYFTASPAVRILAVAWPLVIPAIIPRAHAAHQVGTYTYHAWVETGEAHGSSVVIDNVTGAQFSGYMNADWEITNGSHDGANVSYTGSTYLWGGYTANYTGKDCFGMAGRYDDGITVFQGNTAGWVGTYAQQVFSSSAGNATHTLNITTATGGTLAGQYTTGETATGTYDDEGNFTLTVAAWGVTYAGQYGSGWIGTYTDNWSNNGVFMDVDFRPGVLAIRLDAKTCRTKSTGQLHDSLGWKLDEAGYIETSFRVNVGDPLTITIQADGQQTGGQLPEMELLVGNDTVTWDSANWLVTDHGNPHTTYADYAATFNLDHGTYPLRIRLVDPDAGQALYIKSISFTGPRVTLINKEESLTATLGYFKPFRNSTNDPLFIQDFATFKHNGYTYVCALKKYYGIEGMILARSQDLYNWEVLGDAVSTRTPEDAKDTWAPHVVEVNGTFYMFYTGVTHPQPGHMCQRICVASTTTPEIASSWQRDNSIQFVVDGVTQSWFRPDHPNHYWLPDRWADCRDPMLLEYNGTWHMFYTGTDYGQAIAGVATAPSITGPWTDQGAILTAQSGTAIESVFVIEDPDGGFVMTTNHSSGGGIMTARGTSLVPVAGQPSFGDMRAMTDTTRQYLSGWAHEFLPGDEPGQLFCAALAFHDYTYFVQFMDAYLHEESFGWTVTAGTEPVVNVAPTLEDTYLGHNILLADGTSEYTVTLVLEDENGTDDIKDMRVMFNIDTADPNAARGYLCWGQTPGDVTFYDGDWDVWPATGGGYYGYRNASWGYQYITPVSCVTSTRGDQRTVTWTFTANANWVSAGPADGNYIGMHARDSAYHQTGWQRSSDMFGYTFSVRPAGTDVPPLFRACTVAPTTLVADGLEGYDVSLTVEDYNALSQILDMRVMFNNDFVTTDNVRGYLGWGQTQADVMQYGSLSVMGPATGGGYWGFDDDDWGYQYITPIACATTTAALQRTVTWTFAVEPLWWTDGPGLGNNVGMFTRDSSSSPGWHHAEALFGWTFEVIPYGGPADLDRDSDVDQDDLTVLSNCDSGPAIPHDGSNDCTRADLDADNDVDQLDFSRWQRCYTGEDIVGDPNCPGP